MGCLLQSNVLTTLVLTEQLENADGHGRDVGDEQNAGAQYDQEGDDVAVELGKRLPET